MTELTPEKLLLKEFVFKMDEADEEVRKGIGKAHYAARENLLQDIENILQWTTMQSGKGVSMVLDGSAGVGKTHTITWILNQISSKKIKIKGKDVTVRAIDAPDMESKSGFAPILKKIMTELGKEFIHEKIHEWFVKKNEELQLDLPNENNQQKISKIQTEIKNRDLASMILYRENIQVGTAEDNQWWNWIAGLPVTTKVLVDADMHISDNTPFKDSDTAVEVLKELFLHIIPIATDNKNFFLFCIDECENMADVPAENASVVKGIREMLDTNMSEHIGFVFACNTETEGDLDFAILDLGQIRTRISAMNYKKLEVFESESAKKFIRDVLQSKRMEGFDEKFEELVREGHVEQDMKELYPFKESQIDDVFSYMESKDMTLIPRDILNMLDTLASDAAQYCNNSDEDIKWIDTSKSSPYISPDEGESES